MSCRTYGCSKKISWVVLLLAVAIFAMPAFGQANNCLKDVSRANSCTANDVSVAAVKNGTVNVYQGGLGGGNSCIAGGQFSFTAEFEVKTTSSSTRSNIGIFFGTGQNNAQSGTCTDAILAPPHSCANGTATCGDLNYSEKDGPINGEPGVEATQASCGDTASGDSSADFGPGTHAAILEVKNVTCPASASTCPAGSGVSGSCLVLPVCSSWYQPSNTMPVCESPAPSYPWVAAAIPGAPSKCTCGVLYVPVTPVTITPVVQKACITGTSSPNPPTFDPGFSHNPPTSPTQSPTTCAAGQETNSVSYAVAISNPSNIAGNNAIVDQICDDKYGTVYRSNSFTGPTCPTAGAPTSTTCPPNTSGTTGVAPLATETCTFTVSQSENLTVQDTVTAWGHSALSSSSTFGGTTGLASNPVTVTSTDAPTNTTTSKAVGPPEHACVTVRIDATATNNSGADESVTLTQVGTPGNSGYVSALQDSGFGDITVIHGNANTGGSVTGTTCGIAAGSPGSGTASDLTAADYTDGGSFPKTLDIATGTHPSYTCKFDGVVCGTAAPISKNGTQICAEGISVLNTTLTANLVGDDSSPNGDTVNQTQTPIDVDVCLVPSGN